MELRQLTTFRAVAEALSFTRAAEALNYAQSSVTAQIHGLEDELGVPLFERLGKRVVLSEAGRRLLPYADKLIRMEQEARAQVMGADQPAGTLLVGAPETLCSYRLPPALAQFRRQFPCVQLIFRPGNCNDLRRYLGEGTLDVALLLEEPQQAGGLVIEQLRAEPMVIVAHPEHRLATSPAVPPSALEGEALLLTEYGCSYRLMFEEALSAAGVRPGPVTEFSSMESIKQCIMSGLGVAIMPRVTVAAELENGRMAALNWAGAPFNVVTQVAWHKDKWLSPALAGFLTLVRETLSSEDEEQPLAVAR